MMVVIDTENSRQFVMSEYPYIEKDTGRRFRLEDLTSPTRMPNSYLYIYKGVNRNMRGWKLTRPEMDKLYGQGRLHFSPNNIHLVHYMDEQPSD